jgi:hypothetical protein
MRAVFALSVGMVAMGCAPAFLVGQRPPREPMVAGPGRTVVVEPLFERAEWKTSTKTEFHDVASPGVGVGMTAIGPSRSMAVSRTVVEKPLFAQPATLSALHERLIPAIGVLRPSWRVMAPSAATTVQGPVTVVRTIIDGNELVQSDRALKGSAFGFGLVLLPLQILAAMPVEETQRVNGQLDLVRLPPGGLGPRLIKYASQPDFAVNLSGLPPRTQSFSLDVEYQEGLFADEAPRVGVLLDGFVEKLAFAIVTLIEEESTP